MIGLDPSVGFERDCEAIVRSGVVCATFCAATVRVEHSCGQFRKQQVLYDA